MRRVRYVCAVLALVVGIRASVTGQTADPLSGFLDQHQSDLESDGLRFLREQVRQSSFVLIGGLHGDNETPSLAQSLTAGLGDGPKLVVTEMSPWAAAALPDAGGVKPRGADVEVGQLGRLIRDLGTANQENSRVQEMVALTKGGYQRAHAGRLLELVRGAGELKGGAPGGVPLSTLIVSSLEVEADRASPTTAGLHASLRRERAMKDFFLAHYRQSVPKTKIAAVFGRNHLHRGIDRRGVQTLGNFLSELAHAEGTTAFNVALFAAGGQIAGQRHFDERPDDPAFGYLASVARYRTTVFDMRPLREMLRRPSTTSRTLVQESLLYWADSYDVVICYREVTAMTGR